MKFYIVVATIYVFSRYILSSIRDVNMKRKGAIVISETVLLAFGVIISFVLMASMGSMIFGGQSEAAEESALAFVAKDIAVSIDRVAAEAGSVGILYTLPKGMNVDVEVDYKRLKVSADGKSYSAPFMALTHTRPYTIEKPKYLCMVKNQDDMRIALSDDKCICNTNDNRCDPACIVNADCDPDCNVDEVEDQVCDDRCSLASDNICDRDCFTNEEDKVNEARDCIRAFEDDGKGYKRSTDEDRICDGDSHMDEDSMCDIDCLNNGTSSWGICDVDCNKYNMTDVNGTFVSEDGFCDLDCGYKGTVVKRLYPDGVCDLDCAGPVNTSWLDRSENGICDPDCGGLYDPDCGKCAGEGDDCSSIPCCGEDMGLDLACCPGSMICADNSDPNKPACDGNGWCEISPFSSASEDIPNHIAKWPIGIDGTHPKNWENPYTTTLPVPGHNFEDCTDAADGICYSEQTCIGDWADMNGYYPCFGAAADPDCIGNDNGCAWVCTGPCAADAADCPGGGGPGSASVFGDSRCSTVDDGVCDTDCDLSRWKRWDPDCGEPDCGAKVDIGVWTKSVIDQDGLVWHTDALEVCQRDVMNFLDRRGWDIEQVIENWLADSPDGWAFDGSRYSATLVQPASKTIVHNEDYFADFQNCCPPASSCYGACTITAEVYDKCCGVGYCGDHSTAVTSILRTLGVPAHNVWSAFYNVGDTAHAWNLLQCDSSIENLGKYGNYKLHQGGQFIVDECNAAGDGNWIVVDTTFHEVYPMSTLSGDLYCTSMKDLWNDNGRYGFQGIVCDGQAIIPTDADNCEVNGGDVECDCPWCDDLSSCSIHHPHAITEGCSILADNSVSCPFRRNPMEAGNPMGC